MIITKQEKEILNEIITRQLEQDHVTINKSPSYVLKAQCRTRKIVLLNFRKKLSGGMQEDLRQKIRKILANPKLSPDEKNNRIYGECLK